MVFADRSIHLGIRLEAKARFDAALDKKII